MATATKATIRHEIGRNHAYQSVKHSIEVEIIFDEGEDAAKAIHGWQAGIIKRVETEADASLSRIIEDHAKRGGK